MVNKEKRNRMGYVKEINAEERAVTAYVSTFAWDRMEERFAKGAWSLENFMKNPVVLLQHGFGKTPFPIGKNVEISEDDHGLLAKTVFHQETEEAKIAFELYKKGFLNAFSVGFIPKNFIMEPLPGGERKGIVYTDAELYEYSGVDVPANPGAVLGRETAEMVQKVFGERFLKPIGGDSFLVQPETKKKDGDELEVALKELHGMARTVKGKPLVESQLSLLKSTIDVLHEAVTESSGHSVSEKDMEAFTEVVKKYGEAVANCRPEYGKGIKDSILQVAKALMGRAE